jgi:hypothetical protein
MKNYLFAYLLVFCSITTLIAFLCGFLIVALINLIACIYFATIRVSKLKDVATKQLIPIYTSSIMSIQKSNKNVFINYCILNH